MCGFDSEAICIIIYLFFIFRDPYGVLRTASLNHLKSFCSLVLLLSLHLKDVNWKIRDFAMLIIDIKN